MRLETTERTIRLLAYSADEPSVEALLSPAFSQKLLYAVHAFFQKLKIKFSEYTTHFGPSEYDIFFKSNSKALELLVRSPAQPIKKILLPIPPGMVFNYHETLKALLALLAEHSLISSVTLLSTAVGAARKLTVGDDLSAHSTLERFYLTGKSTVVRSIDQVDSELRKLFDTRRPFLQKPAQELYPTKAILSETLSQFAEIKSVYDANLKKHTAIQEAFDDCDKVISSILENPGHFTKDDLLYLSTGVMNIARLVELHGLALNLLQQVEHLGTMGLKLLIGVPIKK